MARRYKTKFGRVDVYPFTHNHYEQMLMYCLRQRGDDKTHPKYKLWYRNFVLLTLGVNCGLRIEDMLQTTMQNIRSGYFYMKENKTDKNQDFVLNKETMQIIDNYVELFKLKSTEYLFFSRKGINRPLTRQQAYNIIKQCAKAANVKYPVGCHSLRKSFARFYYDDTGDILTVMQMLNHTDPRITMQYICAEQKRVTVARKRFYGVNI